MQSGRNQRSVHRLVVEDRVYITSRHSTPHGFSRSAQPVPASSFLMASSGPPRKSKAMLIGSTQPLYQSALAPHLHGVSAHSRTPQPHMAVAAQSPRTAFNSLGPAGPDAFPVVANPAIQLALVKACVTYL